MIRDEENSLRNLFFEEKGVKAYEGFIGDGDSVVWKEEYVKWLESKYLTQERANIHTLRNRLSRITYLIDVLEKESAASLIPDAIMSAKICVNSLAEREVYKLND